MGAPRRLSPRIRRLICLAFARGTSREELCSSYSLAPDLLSRILAEQGLGQVHKGISEDALELTIRRYLMGEPMSHIARALGISADTLFRRVRAAAPFISYSPSEELRCQIHKKDKILDFETSSTSSPASASGSAPGPARSASRAAGSTARRTSPGTTSRPR